MWIDLVRAFEFNKHKYRVDRAKRPHMSTSSFSDQKCLACSGVINLTSHFDYFDVTIWDSYHWMDAREVSPIFLSHASIDFTVPPIWHEYATHWYAFSVIRCSIGCSMTLHRSTRANKCLRTLCRHPIIPQRDIFSGLILLFSDTMWFGSPATDPQKCHCFLKTIYVTTRCSLWQ